MEAEFKDFDFNVLFFSEEVRKSAVIIAVSRYSIFPLSFSSMWDISMPSNFIFF